jgi:hypothetical protein
MSPIPTTIPITQILNFVILNILYLFSFSKYYYYYQHVSLEINTYQNTSDDMKLFLFQLLYFYSMTNRNVPLTRIANSIFYVVKQDERIQN